MRLRTGREPVKTSPPPRFTLSLAASRPAAGARTPAAANLEDFKHLILPHLDAAYNLARYMTRDAVLVLEIGNERAHFEAAFPRLEVAWLGASAGSDQVLLVTREGLLRATR